MSEEELKEQEKMLKKVAYYQELISTWSSNRMEIGKRILTLSGLAIGLLVTFGSEVSEIGDALSFIIWISASGFFIASMLIILHIFKQNSNYIMLLVQKDNQEKKEKINKSLKCNMRLAVLFFFIGIGLTYFLAIYIVGLPFLKGVWNVR